MNILVSVRDRIFLALIALLLSFTISTTSEAGSHFLETCRSFAAEFANTPDQIESAKLLLLGRCVVAEIKKRADASQAKSSLPFSSPIQTQPRIFYLLNLPVWILTPQNLPE